ncbi:MAG TPA: PQQ-binding-like beta-propeller repeat protein [Candidatus Hydrogenedentes bacterium]|jgi:outer membrane protein assembly factor BamB|nr:PQQ-binding-like beta-propeller repeat protein [Candidatus Hydrogenedentota bacterium]
MKTGIRLLFFGLALAFLCVPGCGREAPVPPAPATPEPAAETPAVPDKARDMAAEASWNTYHGGFSLSGVAEASLPEELTPAWRFMAGASVITTPVAGAGRIYFANTRGTVFAVDTDGVELWSTSMPRATVDQWSPKYQQIDAPLTYFRETVLAGSLDGILFALDAGSGAVKWQADLEGTILGAANIALVDSGEGSAASARVYVIEQGSGVLHCLDFETGQAVWQSIGVERCDGSPGIGGEAVVFGSCAAALHIFSSQTGERLRDIPVGNDSQVAGGVAVLGDEVYSGSRSGLVLRAAASTGAVVWRNTDCTAEVFTTPAVCEHRVIFGCADGDIHGLERESGTPVWTVETGGMATSPVIARDKVVVGSRGTLLLLRLDGGEKLWSHEVSDEITAPAVYDGLVIVGCDDGTVAAFR